MRRRSHLHVRLQVACKQQPETDPIVVPHTHSSYTPLLPLWGQILKQQSPLAYCLKNHALLWFNCCGCELRSVNKGISLEDFKWIYWMEYAHRMWGRALGLLFAGPFVVFLARRSLSRPLISRLLLLFGMGGAQGFVGWWMVKSGLEVRGPLPRDLQTLNCNP